MPYLTLIGGPCPQSRARCDVKLTNHLLSFGGHPYERQETGSPDEMVYVAVGFCEHEWSSWFFIRHVTKPAEFRRVCLKCPCQESMEYTPPVPTLQVDAPEPVKETLVYSLDDTAWITETGWPTGMVGPARLPVESL